jgi:hypothetical protein
MAEFHKAAGGIEWDIAGKKRKRGVLRAPADAITNPAAGPALERFPPAIPHGGGDDSRSLIHAPEIGRPAALASARVIPSLDHN